MFERFGVEARQAIVFAQETAHRLGHDHIGTEHILLGLLEQPRILSAELLAARGLDSARAEAAILRLLPAVDGKPEDLDAGALEAIGIDLAAVREKVEAAFGPGALDQPPSKRSLRRSFGHLSFTGRAKKVMELSLREALRLEHKGIDDGHLLLGLLREGHGLAAQIITEAGIDFAELRGAVESRLSPSDDR